MSSADPLYIEESKELGIFRQHVIGQLLQQKCQIGHINMAFDILKQCMHKMYGSTNIALLVEKSVCISEVDKFSNIARTAVEQAGWANSTTRTIIALLKKMLTYTAISRQFIQRVTTRKVATPYARELGKKYGSLSPDDPVRIMLEEWLEVIKMRTNARSVQSQRNIMRFLLNHCIPGLKMDLNHMPKYITGYVEEHLNAYTIRTICGTSNITSKKNWLTLFVHYMLKCPDQPLQDKWFPPRMRCTFNPDDTMIDDGSDKHKIPVDELEAIYTATEDNTLNRLMFVFMLTTGLRVGGLMNIKTEHVATINGKDILVKDTGRTLEKGYKWVTFMIAAQVKTLIFEWIACYRPAIDSPYLFPGRNGKMSTANVRYRFKTIIKKAGLSGSHLHPHALRHTFAHMMLKTGNAVETVAKLLHHASPKTTQQFYLRESAVEVAARANIPWLDNNNAPKGPIIPIFLGQHHRPVQDEKTERKRAKKSKNRRKAMASLEMFNDTEKKKLSPVHEK